MEYPKDRRADFVIFSILLVTGLFFLFVTNHQIVFPLTKNELQPNSTIITSASFGYKTQIKWTSRETDLFNSFNLCRPYPEKTDVTSILTKHCRSVATKSHKMIIYKDELEAALAKASTDDKIVILTVINKAYAVGDKPMLDLFLDGFWLGEDTRGLIEHLLVVAVDQTSFDRCKFLKLHCYKLETEGVDFAGEQFYMSEDFIKMMWRRTLFLGDVLKRGYNFIFTDTDVLWLRNPFPRLTLNDTIDLEISTDRFNGDQWSDDNYVNTGFYLIKSNNKTIAFLDELYGRRENGLKEQDVLLNLIHDGIFKKLGLKVRFLDTVYFSGFCQDSRDVRVVATVHANCCRYISAKLTDLVAVVHDWKRFKKTSMENDTSEEFRWSGHDGCADSWRH